MLHLDKATQDVWMCTLTSLVTASFSCRRSGVSWSSSNIAYEARAVPPSPLNWANTGTTISTYRHITHLLPCVWQPLDPLCQLELDFITHWVYPLAENGVERSGMWKWLVFSPPIVCQCTCCNWVNQTDDSAAINSEFVLVLVTRHVCFSWTCACPCRCTGSGRHATSSSWGVSDNI